MPHRKKHYPILGLSIAILSPFALPYKINYRYYAKIVLALRLAFEFGYRFTSTSISLHYTGWLMSAPCSTNRRMMSVESLTTVRSVPGVSAG